MDDEEELVALVRAEHPRLVGLLTLHVGDRGTAEELAQDALVRLCDHWPSVRNHDRPGAWLTRVALNLASSGLRRRGAERRARARHDARAVAEATPHETDRADIVAVRRAVKALPQRRRMAIVLRYYADLSVADTAAAMGISPGTVKALCHQALGQLRATGLDLDDPEDAPSHEEVRRVR